MLSLPYIILPRRVPLQNLTEGSIGLSDLCTICLWYRFFKLRTIHPSYLQDKEDEKAFFFKSKNIFYFAELWYADNSRKISVRNFLVLQCHFYIKKPFWNWKVRKLWFKTRPRRGLFSNRHILDSEMSSVLYIYFPLLLCPASALRSRAAVHVVGIFLFTPLKSVSLIFRIMNLAIFEAKKV